MCIACVWRGGRWGSYSGDNHRLGAYAEREKYERNEGINDVEHRVSYKREVPLIEDVPRPQKEGRVEDVYQQRRIKEDHERVQEGGAPALADGLSEAFCTGARRQSKGDDQMRNNGIFPYGLQGHLEDLEAEDLPDKQRAVVAKYLS